MLQCFGRSMTNRRCVRVRGCYGATLLTRTSKAQCLPFMVSAGSCHSQHGPSYEGSMTAGSSGPECRELARHPFYFPGKEHDQQRIKIPSFKRAGGRGSKPPREGIKTVIREFKKLPKAFLSNNLQKKELRYSKAFKDRPPEKGSNKRGVEENHLKGKGI